ncbi:hypothetical protein F4806DRAFT_495880 [Annulohypoxylon nitens]|nr:hypothetical protein F4806DRAFT_495880 [Annulohypoxylon nitens]
MPPPMKPEALWSCDPKSIQQELSDKALKLFAEADNVEIWKTPTIVVAAGVDYKVEQRKLSEQDMKLLWDHNRQFCDIFYVVDQGNLWNRLLITKETWASLTTKHNVFPYFTESILKFGLQEDDDSNTWNNFHSRDPLNGSGDMKPSSDLKTRLPEKLNEFWYDEEFRYSRHPLIHVMILFASLSGWHDYITAQSLKLDQIEGRSFSDANSIDQSDLRPSLEDLQSVQRLRRELFKVLSVLDSTAELSKRIRNIIPRMTVHMRRELTIAIFEELDDFDAEIKHIGSCIVGLRERSSDAANLLLSLFGQSNGKLNLRNTLANEASQTTSAQSLSVMTAMAMNSELGHELQKETSTNIRNLMIVASLYLPVSLLAWLFSSTFAKSDSGTFLDPQTFWKFIAVLVSVAVVIFSVMFILQNLPRYEERDLSTRKMKWGRGWKEWANIACFS